MLIEFEGVGGLIALDPQAIREVSPTGHTAGWSHVICQGGNEYAVKGTAPEIREIVNQAIVKQTTQRAAARAGKLIEMRTKNGRAMRLRKLASDAWMIEVQAKDSCTWVQFGPFMTEKEALEEANRQMK